MNADGSCDSIDAYRFFAFLDLTCHLEDRGIGVFLFALYRLIVRRTNLKVATKRLFHQQVKMPG